MPRFDTVILTARYAGTDTAGRKFRKGDKIAWNSRTRKVVASGDAVDAIERQQVADRFDMDWEDRCASACGL